MKDRIGIAATIARENIPTLDGRLIEIGALTWGEPVPIVSEDDRPIGYLTKIHRIVVRSARPTGDPYAQIVATGYLLDADDFRPIATAYVTAGDGDVTQESGLGAVFHRARLQAVTLRYTHGAWADTTRVDRYEPDREDW